MKNFLEGLVEQWKAASGATRGIAVVALAAITVTVWWISTTAGEPHFKLLYSNQDAQHAASIQNALATGGIRYQASQPPGPFVIWVDEGQYYQAQNLVALSGALEAANEGIQAGTTGAAQVFNSANERAQNALKREWQELEKQLQELEFVQRAHVTTSISDSSPLRKSAPPTVAVTLSLRGNLELSRAQAQTVAKLVRYRFNVPAENVVISDQSGRSLFDGASNGELGGVASSQLENKSRFENDLTARTNELLEKVFGPGLAYVVLSSDWTYDEKEHIKETLDPKNTIAVETTEMKTSTPQGSESGSGGVAGTASLSSEFGTAGTSAAAAKVAEAKTSETKTTKIAGKETEHVRSTTPSLTRMTVSLFLDESLRSKFSDAAQLASLESSVKNAVGFKDQRDVFSSMITPFAAVKRDDKGQPVPPPVVEPESAPSPMLELLLQRGVEIASALVFVFVLLKALKGAPRVDKKKSGSTASAGAGGAMAAPSVEIDENDPRYLAALAKRQIEELVKTEPEKVGSMLSRWVADQETLART